MRCSVRRLTHEQRVLVHQVHPAKLAVDISASVVSNVLPWKHAEWLAIDPKGLLGDRCFDVCQFFRNPGRVPSGVNRRRLDIFCAELDLDRQRTKEWCFVHAMLDACWEFEDGNRWREVVAYAEATMSW